MTNEAECAKLAAIELAAAGWAPATLARIQILILATHNHDPEPHTDAALLVGVDLAICGRTADEFGAYERAIREEFFWVEPDVYR